MAALSKRLVDITAAAVASVVLLPAFAVIGTVVLVFMGRPVLFYSRRAGVNGTSFRLAKFRSMRTGEGSDEERLTRVGRFLRASSLDELPGLWNVLKSDMSLVGPRPLYVEYVSRYSPEQARRLEVKPGLTGWAQIKGRNSLTWDERLALDVWYVDNRSLWLDLKILVLTVPAVLRRKGIAAPGHATMPEFLGEEASDG